MAEVRRILPRPLIPTRSRSPGLRGSDWLHWKRRHVAVCPDSVVKTPISARVERIPENVGDQALRGNLPHQSSTVDGVSGQFHIMITKPLKGLPHGPEFSELGKHQTNGFANSLVGMQSHFAGSVFGISHREPF